MMSCWNHVIAYAEANEKIIASVDEFRKKVADKSVRHDGDPDVSEALTKLEDKVSEFAGWTGRLHRRQRLAWEAAGTSGKLRATLYAHRPGRGQRLPRPAGAVEQLGN